MKFRKGSLLVITAFVCSLAQAQNAAQPEIKRAFETALKEGKSSSALALLKKYPALYTTKFEKGASALHIALSVHDSEGTYERNNFAVVQELVRKGADVNTSLADGTTPAIFWARQPRTIEFLLSAGANPNARDDRGRTPIFYKTSGGQDTEVLRLLKEKGAKANLVDNDGNNPLHVAGQSIGETRSAPVAELIELGADPNAKNKAGETPLHSFGSRGLYEKEGVASLLVQKGAKINVRDNSGQTPLHIAAKANHQASLIGLLENKSAVDLQDNEGRTPLSIAADELLKTQNQKVELGLYEQGETKEIWKATFIQNRLNTISLLLRYGADPHLKGKNGLSAVDSERNRLKSLGIAHDPGSALSWLIQNEKLTQDLKNCKDDRVQAEPKAPSTQSVRHGK